MKTQQACKQLIEAEGEEEVTRILDSHPEFEDPTNWQTYGQVPNNWGVIGNQQSDPTGALVEKIINSMDALLLRPVLSSGIDPEGPNTPGSVKEASEQFYGVPQGSLLNIDDQDTKRKLADNAYLVATGDKDEPNFAMIDRGEGQNPQDFHDTFLSLQATNKIKIPFVQGRFNQGGTGVLPFCGNKHYQLVVSRRHTSIEKDGEWGWTIVKKRPPKSDEKSPVYVYFAPDGKIPSFKSDSIQVLPDKQDNPRGRDLESGTYIKMYSYSIPAKTMITTSLYRRLNLRLFEMPLPLTLHEGRDYQSHTKHAYLEGMRVRLESRKYRDEVLVKPDFPISSKIRIGDGMARVKIWLLQKDIRKYRWIKPEEAINFTINGQTHASWSRRFFARKAVKKDYLKDNLLVEVDCTELPSDTISELFMGSRDRMRDTEVKDEIESILEELISEDPVLKEWNKKWREEKVKEDFDDPEKTEDILKSLMDASPEISLLLGQKGTLKNPLQVGEENDKEEFNGNEFPSFFEMLTPDQLDLPINSYKMARFQTDVNNDFFDRSKDPGDVSIEPEEWVKSWSLRNGEFRITVEAPDNQPVEIGDTQTIQIQVASKNKDFKKEFEVEIIEAKDKKDDQDQDQDNEDEDKDQGVSLPLIQGVYKDNWPLLGWDEKSVLEVHTHEQGTDIFVNLDNEHLNRIRSQREYVNRQEEIEQIFKIGMGITGFALNNELPEDTPDEMFDRIIKTLAMTWLPNVLNLAGSISLT